MSIVSILLSTAALVLAWFTVGPGWLPLATATVAALLAFSQTIAALRAKDWGHWSLRALVIALVVLMALPTIGQMRPQETAAPALADAGPLSLPPAVGTTDSASVPAAVISNDPPLPSNLDVTTVHARTTSLEQRVSKTRFNLGARIAALGDGVDPAFAFVRDSIGFDSYPGVLRGDRGTFLARAGNSWDRALLLTAILNAKGVRTRFATARLDDQSAEQLFERLFVAPTPAAGDPPVTASATRDTAFSDRIKARATRDLGLVRAALAGAWPPDAGVSRDAVIAELREHAWIQAEVGAGWQDLDPSLPNSRPGQPLMPAESTFEEVPEDRYQHVTIRLLAETLSDGDLATTPRLEWTARAPEVLDRTMFLTHVPSGTGATGKLARMAGEQWRPALWLGETIHTGDPVSFGSSGSNNSAGNFFFGESATTLVAEWLELEFDQTGGRTETTRRALYDRATPAARAGAVSAKGLLPVPMVDNGPVPALALHNLWFTAGGHDLAAYANTIATLSAEIPELGKSELEPGAQLSAMAMANFSFLVYSDHIILPSVNDAPGVRLYADSPRALIFSLSPDSRGPGAATSVYDLHRDRVRAIARDATQAPAAINRKIWFGLLEGALEHELTAADVADAGGTADHYLTTSALVTGLGVATMREGTTDQALALAGDQSRADRMLAAVARGAALVVPRPAPGQPARGWWEIAANGDTKAVTDGDLGGSVAWGKGLGGGRIGSGYGTPDGRMPRLIRPRPTPGGSGSQEYLTLLTTIALAVIIAFEIIGFTIHLRAVMRGMTVLESMDRDFGSE